MVGIWELEGLQDLEDSLLDAFRTVRDIVREGDGEVPDNVDRLSFKRIFIGGEWGNGTAEGKSDIIEVFIAFDLDDVEKASLTAIFDRVARTVTVGMQDLITSGEVNIPDVFIEESSGINIQPVPHNIVPGEMNRELGEQEGSRIFDLTGAQAIENRKDVPFRQLPRIPLEELLSEDEEEEEQEGDELEELLEPEEEEPELTEEERLAEKFPDITPALRVYAKETGGLEIPSGKKNTRKVENREPYDFEIIMATDRPNPLDLPYQTDPSIIGDVMPDIGREISRGTFGTVGQAGDRVTPATYPQTSTYIRNHLLFNGPSYILEMYKDLVYYSGLISQIHGYNLRVGKYDSFREFIYVLRQIGERKDVQLIEGIDQRVASLQGLETVPDHPTIEGEKAPWLQRRQYYELVEENKDHPAWDNPYDYLHGDDDEE